MEFLKDKLQVKIAQSRKEMGEQAAEMVAERILKLLQIKEEVNIIFAAAPSQNEFLASLIEKDIDWSRVNAYHMDEYLNLDAEAPQGFGNFLKERIFGKVNFKSVNYLNGNAEDSSQECIRYESLLKNHQTDIACMGIGENTHLAFNDPHVANFEDEKYVKTVDLDEPCRIQQVNDGCFQALSEVPTHALTLTIPALIKADYVYCIVPGEKKADAVKHTLEAEVSEKYPSTILRKHNHAILFLEKESSHKVLSLTETAL